MFLCASVAASICVSNQSSGDVILSEVFYDSAGSDNGNEWVELFNDGLTAVDLSTYSFGYGGSDYTFGTLQLSGIIAPGQYFVAGGIQSNADNGNPVFDFMMDFSPDIQNNGTTGDGLALFNVTAASITSSTVPINAVIYGPTTPTD